MTRERPLVMIVDDDPDNREIVKMRLESQSYDVSTAQDGQEGLDRIRELLPDLVILDVMMPVMDGIETLRQLRADNSLPFIPVVMLTAKGDLKDVVAGLDLGADDYLVKPIEQSALVARVRSMLRLKQMQVQIQSQADELSALNVTLEKRVNEQVQEIGRMQQLRRFLSPQIAATMLSEGGFELLQSHRREIVSLFCDLRGFTAFAETAEPEDVMSVLREYHTTIGPIIHEHEGTIERFAGDGMLVFFNDPIPCDDPALQAVRLGVAMRAAVLTLRKGWTKRGYDIGFSVGIAQGFATLGIIGFEERMDYAPIGTVTNTAARLCDHASDNQVLVTHRIAVQLESIADIESLGEVSFKGIARPIPVSNVTGIAPD